MSTHLTCFTGTKAQVLTQTAASSSAPAAAAAGIQGEIVAWYTLALKDMADLPCDSIARLLRRREAIATDKRLRVSILKHCADVAAAFLAGSQFTGF